MVTIWSEVALGLFLVYLLVLISLFKYQGEGEFRLRLSERLVSYCRVM